MKTKQQYSKEVALASSIIILCSLILLNQSFSSLSSSLLLSGLLTISRCIPKSQQTLALDHESTFPLVLGSKASFTRGYEERCHEVVFPLLDVLFASPVMLAVMLLVSP
jgi:hypothetical protein